MYLQFISFLHTDMTQVHKILPRERQGLAYFTINIIDADDMVTLGARVSAAMILTSSDHDNPVPAR